MTLTITLPPSVQAQVEAEARAAGVSVQEFLPQLITRALPPQSHFPTQNGLPLSEWMALLYQVPDSIGRDAPTMITNDDLRRENLYEERA